MIAGPGGILRILALVVLLASATEGEEMKTDRNVIDFRSESSRWAIVNDGVMGGLSRSNMTRTDTETGIFRGDLSLERNGGFASVRTAVAPFGTDTDGLEIRVRGDGRSYQLRLRTDDRFDGVAYRADFATEPRKWTTVRIAFADFQPTYRGRLVRQAGPLDPARVRQLGFLLADKNAGEFDLEIDWVRIWKDSQ